jgi:hypothetical protein
MTKKPNYESPLSFTSGSIVKAVYREPEITAYAGNPLQEALPPILNRDQLILKLQHFPDYDESLRNAPDELRYLLIHESVRCFVPSDIHIDLYRRFNNVIRIGYAARNPMAPFMRVRLPRNYSFDQYADQPQPAPGEFLSTAQGFSITGISGAGKSFSIDRVLRLFPQVIHHSEFDDRAFTHSQIVWLKIDCPFDGNPRGLCISFLKALDALLGTRYRYEYAKPRQVQAELLSDMTRAAANHYIGVLVIDEIQRLSVAKSGGAEILLNFFIQLVNEIGIPVVLVGTYKALQVLSRQFSQMRRGTGQGDLIWDRMQNEEEWQKFVKKLFRAQYTHKKFAPDDRAANSSENKNNLSGEHAKTLSDILYDESQGITDLAVKLYIFAQERAINSHKEIVNESVIRSVARDKFKTLKPVLTAIRLGDERALNTWDDVYPAAVRKYLEFKRNAGAEVAVKGHLGSTPQIQAILNTKKSDSFTLEQQSESTSDNIQSQAQRQSTISDDTSGAKSDPRKGKQGVLPNLIADVDKDVEAAAYEVLKKAGHVGIRNPLV